MSLVSSPLCSHRTDQAFTGKDMTPVRFSDYLVRMMNGWTTRSSGHFVFPMSFPLAFIVRSRWVSWWINSLFLFLAPFLVKLNLFHHFCTVLCKSVAFRVLIGWSELCYLLTFPVFPYLYPVKQRVLSELCEYLSLEGNQKFKLKMLLTVMSWI